MKQKKKAIGVPIAKSLILQGLSSIRSDRKRHSGTDKKCNVLTVEMIEVSGEKVNVWDTIGQSDSSKNCHS
jgi:hypothetical protein